MSSPSPARICVYTTLSLLVLFLGLPLLMVYTVDFSDAPGLDFSVERAYVKAFDLTPENRLFCIFGFSRAHTGDTKHPMEYDPMEVEVRKGGHRMLAWDVVKAFDQHAGNVTTVLEVEATALYDPLEAKLGDELRKERKAAATAVDVVLLGLLGPGQCIRVVCQDVKVYFDGVASSRGQLDESVVCSVRVFASGGRN